MQLQTPSAPPSRPAPAATLHGCIRGGFGEHGSGRTLLTSDLVEILDARCRGETGRGWSAAAPTSAHEVQVIRHGAYARSLNGRVTLVHSGVAVFGNPGDEVCIAHPVAGGDARSIFRVSPDGLRAIAGDDADDRGSPAHAWRADRPIDGRAFLQHQLAVHAARRAETNPLMRLAAEERALGFLRAVVSLDRSEDARAARAGSSRESRNRRAREYAMRVRAVIAEHYREPLTLAAVAARVGCSPYHLTRIVTAYEGAPIHRLLIRHRLRQGLERVLGTRDALSGIALDLGFASQSHFGDSFRREFGCPPGTARRMGAVDRFPARAPHPPARDIPLQPSQRP